MKSKPKACHAWANYYPEDRLPHLHTSREDADAFADSDAATVKVAVIPLDDVEAIIEKAVDAAMKTECCYHESMRVALAAIGVLPNKRKGRK